MTRSSAASPAPRPVRTRPGRPARSRRRRSTPVSRPPSQKGSPRRTRAPATSVEASRHVAREPMPMRDRRFMPTEATPARRDVASVLTPRHVTVQTGTTARLVVAQLEEPVMRTFFSLPSRASPCSPSPDRLVVVGARRRGRPRPVARALARGGRRDRRRRAAHERPERGRRGHRDRLAVRVAGQPREHRSAAALHAHDQARLPRHARAREQSLRRDGGRRRQGAAGGLADGCRRGARSATPSSSDARAGASTTACG